MRAFGSLPSARRHGRAVATTSSALPARLRAVQTSQTIVHSTLLRSTKRWHSGFAFLVNRQTETTEADPKPNGTPTQTAIQRQPDSHRKGIHRLIFHYSALSRAKAGYARLAAPTLSPRRATRARLTLDLTAPIAYGKKAVVVVLFRGRVPSSCSPLVGWSGLRRPRQWWSSWWEVSGRFVGESRTRRVVFTRGQRPAVLRLLRASAASPCCVWVGCRLRVGLSVVWSSAWHGGAAPS